MRSSGQGRRLIVWKLGRQACLLGSEERSQRFVKNGGMKGKNQLQSVGLPEPPAVEAVSGSFRPAE